MLVSRRVKVSSHRNFVCSTVGAVNNNYNPYNNNSYQDSLQQQQQQDHQHRCLGLATINPLHAVVLRHGKVCPYMTQLSLNIISLLIAHVCHFFFFATTMHQSTPLALIAYTTRIIPLLLVYHLHVSFTSGIYERVCAGLSRPLDPHSR